MMDNNGVSKAEGEPNHKLISNGCCDAYCEVKQLDGTKSLRNSRNGSSPAPTSCWSTKQVQNIDDALEESHEGLGRWLDSCYRLFRYVTLEINVGMREVVCGTKLCLLFLVIPFAFVAVKMELGRGWIFASSLLAIAPLAERLGFVTEQLAYFTGPTAGGLLNATFGNATELIISIFALQKRMIRVVQLSLLGSILSNMLLVLGCSIFVGGLTHFRKDQKFNKHAAVLSTSLLLMGCMGLLLPAVLHATGTGSHDYGSELTLSRLISVVLVLAYGFYLYFQLKSHKRLYETRGDCGETEDMCEEEESVLSFWCAIVWLGILTLFISILSEYLVDAIQGAAESWSVPVAFISVIILPIVGNAAEHGSAVVFALKDKLDISLGVGIGSSTQISMFVIPLCVLLGWIFGIDMDLNFEIFETATLFITVLVVSVLLQDGTANYFKGLMLILCYIMVGASFWFHDDNNSEHHGLGFAKHLIHKTFCTISSYHCQVVDSGSVVVSED